MKKKILIISAVFPPEPVTTAYMNYDLAIDLQEKYDVTVLRAYPTRPEGSEYKADEIKHDYPFECIALRSYTCPSSSLIGRFRESISFGLACRKYIKEHHKSFSYVYNASWQLFGYFIVAKTAVHYGIPYMIPIQDIYPESLFTGKAYPKIFRRIASFFLIPLDRYYQKHAHKVRTITEEMRDYLSKTRNVSKNNYLVVNNWQENECFSYIEPRISPVVTFAYVGSINNHSNTGYIIKSFLRAGMENARLVIYGKGNKKEECIQIVRQMQAEDRIIFDAVARDDVPRVQSEADVLVLALPKDNARFSLPSKITSYMLSGRPVLASVDEISASTRYIKESGSGIAVPPDNEFELSEAFLKFSRMSYEERKAMGQNGRAFALAHLTKEANLTMVANEITNHIENTR